MKDMLGSVWKEDEAVVLDMNEHSEGPGASTYQSISPCSLPNLENGLLRSHSAHYALVLQIGI